jgi:S1-C subfamily serine protease
MTRRSVASRIAVLLALAAAVVSSVLLATPAASASATRTAAVTDPVVNIYTRLAYQGSEAAGTGIVIGSSGLVLTNNHVIRGATTLRAVNVGNGRSYTATVLGYSVANDVALLQLKNASGLATARIGGPVKVGTPVAAYGNGHGAGGVPEAAPGTVRAVGRSITASDGQGGSERLTELIQTDVGLEPGDSGGPLIDANGRVVGMNTAASTGFRFDYSQTSTRAFAIPIQRALAIAKQIRQGKTTATVHVGPTAMLGVSVSYRSTNFGGYSIDASGALVASVVPGSPAAQAGIAAGSMITAVGTKTIDSPDDLARELLRFAPNDSVRITWLDQVGTRSQATARLAAGPPQ